MRPFRFLHTADLHLGTPFQGVRAKLPERWTDDLIQASYGVFRRIVDIALAEQVNFVTIAGDLFDAARVPMSVQFELRRGFERLEEAGVPVFVIHGNHDPLSGPSPLRWPAQVHVFPAAPMEKMSDFIAPSAFLELDVDTRIQVSGFSYRQAEMVGSYADAFVRDDRADFSIALYHGAIGDGHSKLHANYCASSVQALAARGFDVWALGHIHQPGVLVNRDPLVFYPGIPQGRHIHEPGALGCVIVDVDEHGAARIRRAPTSTIAWRTCTVSLTAETDLGRLPGRVVQAIADSMVDAPQLASIVRLELTGVTPLHAQLADEESLHDVLSEALAQSGLPAVLERLVVHTRPDLDRDVLSRSSEFIGEFLRLVDQFRAHPDEARSTWSALLADVFHAGNGLALRDEDDDDLLGLLDAAEQMVLGMMSEVGADEET